MIATWYVFLSFMLIAYVVLDGRNFGVGMLHWLVAKNPAERRQVVAALGPLWPWDEVWLIGFGGTAFAVFPQLLASAFSGYYLAFFLILWCFILRGIALEVGGHMEDPMWRTFWDFVFGVSSLLLGLVFGAAGGNVARGVPLDAQGNFSLAFFTNFGVRGNVGLLDWYTVSVSLMGAVMLAAHGATYLTLKTDGPVHERSRRYANGLWFATIPLFLIISIETVIVRPELMTDGIRNPITWFGIIVVIAAAIALSTGLRHRQEWKAFIGSAVLIGALLGTGAATIFPVMLHSTLDPANSLTAYNCAANHTSLGMALIWWPVGVLLTISHYALVSRYYIGKVSVTQDDY